MSRLNDLLARRATLINESRTILDAADPVKGLSGEEQQKYDRIEADIVGLDNLIKAEERTAAREAEMRGSQGTIANRQAPASQSEARTGTASDEYRAAHWKHFRHGKAALHESEYRALSIGTDSAGGYTAPDEFERKLIMALEVENVMRSLATVITTSSGDRQIPVASAHGAASWTGEGAAFSESDETFGQVLLGAHKLTRIIKVSEELLNDSAFNLETYLSNEYGRSFGAAEEAGFVNGDGSAKPTGLVGAAQVGVTATTGAATSVTSDYLIDLYHSLKRPYRRNATWMFADSTAKAIRKLKDADNNYLWQPGLTAGQPDTILNRPVVTSDNVPAMAANAKSIVFGDIKYYWIADRTGRVFQRLGELYAANGQIGFRAYQRVDGKLTLAEAVKVYVNSAT